MNNRYYTLMMVPEKSAQVKKWIIPRSLLRGALFFSILLLVLSGVLIFDYVNIINQVNENKRLRVKNRMLLQKVQEFNNRMQALDDSFDRIRTFSTKLRIITNLEDSPGVSPQDVAPDSQREGIIDSVKLHLKNPLRTSQYSKENPYRWIGGDSSAERDITGHAQHLKKRTLIEAAQDIAHPNGSLDPLDRGKNSDVWRLPYDDAFDADFSEDLLSLDEKFNHMNEAYDYLLKKSKTVEIDVQDLYEEIHNKKTRLVHTPMGRPDHYRGWITSRFGWRVSPYDGRRKMHEGIDIAAAYGTEIHAPADGVINFAGIRGSFGKVVVIDHGYGVKTYYGHNSRIIVKKGQRVKRGSPISQIGSSGRSTGPHLHYEVRVNGVAVDPYPYLLEF